MKLMIDLQNLTSDEDLQTVSRLAGISLGELKSRVHNKVWETSKTLENIEKNKEHIPKEYFDQMTKIVKTEINFLDSLRQKLDKITPTVEFKIESLSQVKRFLDRFQENTEQT